MATVNGFTAEKTLEMISSRDAQIDEIIDVTLPNIQANWGELFAALDVLNNETLPGLHLELEQLQLDLAANTEIINNLNDVILPQVQLDLTALENNLDELNTVTLPGLNDDLSSLSSSLTTLNGKFPIVGTDISDGAISTPKMTANSIDGDRILANSLQAAKIVAGSITTDRMTANSIDGDRILANSLQAAKIVAGSISTDRMTFNSISGDRIATNSLHADRIVTGSISTDKMTANTIHGSVIAAGTMSADRLDVNTINAALILAGDINAISLTGTTIDNGKVFISDDDITISGDIGRATNNIFMSATAMYLGAGATGGFRPGFAFDVDLSGKGGTTHTVGHLYFDNGFVSDVKFTATKVQLTDPTTSSGIPNTVIDTGGNIAKSSLNITQGAADSGGSGWRVLRVPN